MKKRFAYVLMAAATFVLGVVVSPIHFRGYSIGCGPTGSSSQFTSSYFLNLVSSESYYESLEETDAAWQEKIKKADSVSEQNALFNRVGEKTGSRAVIRSRWDDGKQYFAVVWTEKKVLREVTCSSRAHVLAFEKKPIP
jgi:coproporphyrinogen III oxidase-like Fe-S oxidoreductase